NRWHQPGREQRCNSAITMTGTSSDIFAFNVADHHTFQSNSTQETSLTQIPDTARPSLNKRKHVVEVSPVFFIIHSIPATRDVRRHDRRSHPAPWPSSCCTSSRSRCRLVLNP